MEMIYSLKGMTCGSCETHVQDALQAISGVTNVKPDREAERVSFHANKTIPIETLQVSLPDKYSIAPLPTSKKMEQGSTSVSTWQQLRPLFLVLSYILGASILLHVHSWSWMSFMADFMGLFLLTFSFFKFLDYKNFPASFTMYDPLAKRLPFYAWIYPFIETILGLAFLFRFQLVWTISFTLLLLTITTVGVVQSIVSKKKIKCACLGTALNLPMTEATLIENAIMIAMGALGLVSLL